MFYLFIHLFIIHLFICRNKFLNAETKNKSRKIDKVLIIMSICDFSCKITIKIF